MAIAHSSAFRELNIKTKIDLRLIEMPGYIELHINVVKVRTYALNPDCITV